jgi:hypothetical protein
MCDYSLEFYRSRPAVNEEQYTLHRFDSGTLGFIAGTDCTTAVCMPAGVRLRLEGLDKRLQRALCVGPTEEAVMIRLPFRDNFLHRDGVRFSNGREVLLQGLNAGLSAMLMPRDLTAIFNLKGVAEPESVETEAFVPALDRHDAGATMSSSGPVGTVGRIGQHCMRIARTFRQVAWQRYASAVQPSSNVDA